LKSLLRNTKGETIAETLIALSVVALGFTLAMTLMSNSLSNVNSSKNRVIAVNLAREGIEAVRNIRDTNWLKFSNKRRTCWNHLPQNIDLAIGYETCDGSTVITPDSDNIPANGYQNYIAYQDKDFRWRLTEATTDNKYLYFVDIDPSTNSDGININPDGTPVSNPDTNDRDIYNHKVLHVDADGTEKALNYFYTEWLPKEKTIFTRIIKISYLPNNFIPADVLKCSLEQTTSCTKDAECRICAPNSCPSGNGDCCLGTTVGCTEDAECSGINSQCIFPWPILDDAKNALNRMEVTAEVSWPGAPKPVVIKTRITDYLGRDNLSN